MIKQRIAGVAVILAITAAAGSQACSSDDSTNGPQCTVDADCAAKGLAGTVCVASTCVARGDSGTADASDDAPGEAASDAGADPWACLGNVVWPAENPSKPVKHNLTAR